MSVRLFVYLAFCCAMCGCMEVRKGVALDAEKNQPWVAPGVRAVGRISMWQSMDDGEHWLEWIDEHGAVIDSRRVTKRAEKYLKRVNAWLPPEVVKPESVEIHAPTPSRLTIGVQRRMTIVCLDPLVVVISPGSVQYHEFRQWVSQSSRQRDGAWELDVLLDRGFTYGTVIPFSPELSWFSPDLRMPPKKVETISATERRIEVPWGALQFQKHDNTWNIVAGEEKQGQEEKPGQHQSRSAQRLPFSCICYK